MRSVVLKSRGQRSDSPTIPTPLSDLMERLWKDSGLAQLESPMAIHAARLRARVQAKAFYMYKELRDPDDIYESCIEDVRDGIRCMLNYEKQQGQDTISRHREIMSFLNRESVGETLIEIKTKVEEPWSYSRICAMSIPLVVMLGTMSYIFYFLK